MRELEFGRKGAALGTAKHLVVFLHGYGANGQDLLELSDSLMPHLPNTAFVAPNAPQPCLGNPFGRQWFSIPRFDGSTMDQAEAGLMQSAEDLNAFLDARLAEEGLEPKDLVLVGFSQGAMMSLHVAPRRAAQIGGVVAISGRLVMPEALEAAAISRPPVLLMHGDADDVVPFESMQEAGNALNAAGFEVYGYVMQGAGHGISPDGLGTALGFIQDRLNV